MPRRLFNVLTILGLQSGRNNTVPIVKGAGSLSVWTEIAMKTSSEFCHVKAIMLRKARKQTLIMLQNLSDCCVV